MSDKQVATDFPEDPAAFVLKGKELRESQQIWLFISIILYSFFFSLQPFVVYSLFHSTFSLILFPFYYGWHICFCYIYTFYCKSAPFSQVASSKHFTRLRTYRLSILLLRIGGPSPVFRPYSGVRLQNQYIPHCTFITTLKMETALSSEMLFTLFTTRCHIWDESSLRKIEVIT